MLETEKFTRNPFEVEAVQVTAENIELVAKWCKGTVRRLGIEGQDDRYIDVKVHRPQTDRQKQARIGDWVLWAGTSFKCYLPTAFAKSFTSTNVTVSHPEVKVVSREETGAERAADVLVELIAATPEPVEVKVTEQPSKSPSPAFLAALAESKNVQRS